MPNQADGSRKAPIVVSAVFIFLSLVWVFAMGLGDPLRMSLALVTMTCSFGVGSLIGFVITIFGDELEALGKARDSMIALLSGITGVGVAKITAIGSFVGTIQLFPHQNAASSWFSVLFISTYTISGFYAMYFFRRLFLNPALQEAHDQLERKTDLSNRASEVLIKIEKKLPKGILSGREEIEEEDAHDDDSKVLKEALLSKEVDEFLAICEDEVAKGTLSTDLISKASVLHYYRIRFNPPESSERNNEIAKSIEWLTRASMIDPFHPEPQIKLAVVYGLSGDDHTCLSILDRLEHNESSPQYLDQWLGFYLLFGDRREEDSIKHTMEYLKKFPDDTGASLLNLARAYAQMLKRKIGDEIGESSQLPHYRTQALKYLKEAVALDPEIKATAKRLTSPNQSFETLANDPEFLDIVSKDEKGS